jgi:hypothetical protein
VIIMVNNDNIKKMLYPGRFPGMSPKMMAIVGYLIESKFTSPSIEEMIVTSDGFLMARVSGDIGCNDMLGTVSEFKKNWNTLIHISNLGLSQDEIEYLEILPSVMIRNYGE